MQTSAGRAFFNSFTEEEESEVERDAAGDDSSLSSVGTDRSAASAEDVASAYEGVDLRKFVVFDVKACLCRMSGGKVCGGPRNECGRPNHKGCAETKRAAPGGYAPAKKGKSAKWQDGMSESHIPLHVFQKIQARHRAKDQAETQAVLESPTYQASLRVGNDEEEKDAEFVDPLLREQAKAALSRMDAELDSTLDTPVIKNPERKPKLSFIDQSDPLEAQFKTVAGIDTDRNAQQFLAAQKAEEERHQQETAALVAQLQRQWDQQLKASERKQEQKQAKMVEKVLGAVDQLKNSIQQQSQLQSSEDSDNAVELGRLRERLRQLEGKQRSQTTTTVQGTNGMQHQEQELNRLQAEVAALQQGSSVTDVPVDIDTSRNCSEVYGVSVNYPSEVSEKMMPPFPREAQEELKAAIPDFTAGTTGTYGGGGDGEEDSGTTRALVENLAMAIASTTGRSKMDSTWKSRSAALWKVRKNKASFDELVKEIEIDRRSSESILENHKGEVDRILRDYDTEESVVRLFCSGSTYIQFVRNSFELHCRLIMHLKRSIEKHGWTSTQSLITHHGMNLKRCRSLACNRFQMLLKSYVYLRDADLNDFWSPTTQNILNETLLALVHKSNGGGGGGSGGGGGTGEKGCPHCGSKRHRGGKDTCPLLKASIPKAAAKDLATKAEKMDGTFATAVKKLIAAYQAEHVATEDADQSDKKDGVKT